MKYFMQLLLLFLSKLKNLQNLKPCWADFFVYNNVRLIQSMPGAWVPGQFYVWIEEFLAKVDKLPRVSDYIREREGIIDNLRTCIRLLVLLNTLCTCM